MSRTLRTPTLLGNQMQDFAARLPSYRGISPYPAPPQETAQYAGDATVPSFRGGTSNMSMAPSAPTITRTRTMAAPVMVQPAAPPVMSPTLRTSIAGREQQADLYAALPSTLPGGGPVSPSALRQRTALVTKMRGIDDRLTAPFVAQPVPEDPRIGVARAEAEGRVGAARATAEAQANRQQQQQQFQAGQNEEERKIKRATTQQAHDDRIAAQNKPPPSTQPTANQQSEIDRRGVLNERDRQAMERQATDIPANIRDHILMSHWDPKTRQTDWDGVAKDEDAYRKAISKVGKTAPTTQPSAPPQTGMVPPDIQRGLGGLRQYPAIQEGQAPQSRSEQIKPPNTTEEQQKLWQEAEKTNGPKGKGTVGAMQDWEKAERNIGNFEGRVEYQEPKHGDTMIKDGWIYQADGNSRQWLPVRRATTQETQAQLRG